MEDPDIAQYILTPEEEKLKTIIWEKMNEDWLTEQKEKEKLRKNTQPKERAAPRPKEKKNEEPAASAVEAIKGMKCSSRLNPRMLEKLF